MSTDMEHAPAATTPEAELRERAVRRLKKVRDFWTHLVVYVLVNGFFVGIWAVTNSHGFFWPVFPIGGWGIGLVMNAWDVFFAEDFPEDKIQREMHRLSGR